MSKDADSKPNVYSGGGGSLLWIGLGVDLRLPLGKIAFVIGFRSGVHIPLVSDAEPVYKGPFLRWNIGMEWGSGNNAQ